MDNTQGGQQLQAGMWIRVTTNDKRTYTAKVVEALDYRVTLDLLVRSGDHQEYFKTTWLTPGEIVSWTPTARPVLH